MNVSELSDVELNRAMIWFYSDKLDGFIYWHFQRSLQELSEDENLHDDGKGLNIQLDEWEWDVNFLSGYLSWDLTMPLAVEHGLCIKPAKATAGWLAYTSDNHSFLNKNPLRAICEVLIMIAMEKKG